MKKQLSTFESAVLSALEEVENALVAYADEQVRRESLVQAADAADRAVVLAQDLYSAGLTDFQNVLDAQRPLLAFRDQLAVSDGTVTSNLVQRYKALGGGWTPVEASGDNRSATKTNQGVKPICPPIPAEKISPNVC